MAQKKKKKKTTLKTAAVKSASCMTGGVTWKPVTVSSPTRTTTRR